MHPELRSSYGLAQKRPPPKKPAKDAVGFGPRDGCLTVFVVWVWLLATCFRETVGAFFCFRKPEWMCCLCAAGCCWTTPPRFLKLVYNWFVVLGRSGLPLGAHLGNGFVNYVVIVPNRSEDNHQLPPCYVDLL